MVNPSKPVRTPQILSMTGFASLRGAAAGQEWLWELRAVNGKGFDLKTRLPEGFEPLEPVLRARIGAEVARGNLSLSLKLGKGNPGESPRLNPRVLAEVLTALKEVEAAARAQGLTLAPSRASDILTLRGVQEAGPLALDLEVLRAPLLADLEALLADFDAMRAREGAALAAVLSSQVTRVAELTEAASLAAAARRPEMAAQLHALVAGLTGPGADAARLTQELALLAVKADVMEEVDRLRAHIAAARAHLAGPGPVGRKLEFLVQEFLREANTLCSKAGSAALTAIGLDLKHVIDQMREQIQNVE
jgi:uncharacterized protein (TIGR00255 family)